MARGDHAKLDKIARILKSFGIASDSIWLTLHSWWHEKTATEKRLPNMEDAVRPLARDLQGWLKQHYTETFEVERKSSIKGPPIRVTYERLKKFVDDRVFLRKSLTL
ncbi:hypothetical protein OESDEN_16083 [Oesophagostomum dentatum]|uniref:Uncharacterized protein n=1 Tax=Oesophagostomum dentatum TaxID=61180 RepID=A0A0B1SK05_OESDE|nr:hypothetical protein OESDEN_16083 [Oesophagostomum dentatum]